MRRFFYNEPMYKHLSILKKLRTIYFLYVALLIVGGCIAYMVKNSWISLVVSILSSFAIICFSWQAIVSRTRGAFLVVAILTLVFFIRYLATGRIFPSGALFTSSLGVLWYTYPLYKEYYSVSENSDS